jgi:ankyrin repeat protein
MNEFTAREREAMKSRLIYAAYAGRDADVALLLNNVDKMDDVNVMDKSGNLAIVLAAQEGRHSVVAQFIACERVDVNAADSEGVTAMMIAANKGHGSIVAQFIASERTDVNAAPESGTTAIMTAADHSHDSIVAQFIACERVNVNAADNEGNTAVVAASVNDNESIVRLLVACERVDINVSSARGVTAIVNAAWCGNSTIVDFLAEAGAILSVDSRLRQFSLHGMVAFSTSPASPLQKIKVYDALKKHGIISSNVPLGFQSKYYFQDGRGEFYMRNVKYQRWINRKDLFLCLHHTYNWSVENQVEEEVHRTLPPDLSKVGHFVASCFFDVAGGNYGNGIVRLIVQYYGGFDASKSQFALRGTPKYGKLPDNAHRCSNCLEKKESKALRACSSCGVVRYCGKECQKIDWKRHKASCKLWSEEKKKKGGGKKK